ncbi:21 kDa subunit of NADH dehydrogenase [Hypomontagnella monticulosa]|nr:21 kDa subunit of NADH dehydrogenase [Hypomontagnella monticulosa]
MASKAVEAVAKAAGGVMSVSQKQTVQSTGIWELIRRAFAVDPNRSNGVPLNPYFRNPTPGGQDPLGYDDPVTIPAGDIADNPYWKRDARRAYPKLSFVTQGDAVALLTVGSAVAPKQELIGEAGQKALVAAQEEGKTTGLATFFEKSKDAAKETLLVNGLPPFPSGQRKQTAGNWHVHDYALSENSYPDEQQYPCRSFK